MFLEDEGESRVVTTVCITCMYMHVHEACRAQVIGVHPWDGMVYIMGWEVHT